MIEHKPNRESRKDFNKRTEATHPTTPYRNARHRTIDVNFEQQ